MFHIIVAHDKNQIIGHHLALPWHFHEDLQHFRHKTISDGPNVLIMGRITFESLPTLKGRDIIVVTSRDTLSEDNVTTVDSIHSLLSYLSTKNYKQHFKHTIAELNRQALELQVMEKRTILKTNTNSLSKELLIKRKACEKTCNG